MPTTPRRGLPALLAATATLGLALATAPAAQAQSATSALYSPKAVIDFCNGAQQFTASTSLTAVVVNHNQLGSFTFSSSAPYDGPNLSAYNGKGADGVALPLTVQQWVNSATLSTGWDFPQIISCKMKDAESIQFYFGASAAGAQRTCRDLNEKVVADVYATLTSLERRSLRYQQASVILDPDSQTLAGPAWLGGLPNFKPGLVYLGTDGQLHIRSKQNGVLRTDPSLLAGPDKKGSYYCHFPAPEYVRNVVLGRYPPCTSLSESVPDVCFLP